VKLVSFKNGKNPGFMLRVSQDEALTLISSLSAQMRSWDPNSERHEEPSCVLVQPKGKETGCYFSISVQPYPVRMPLQFKNALQKHLLDKNTQEAGTKHLDIPALKLLSGSLPEDKE
jgi:hypothetical protein